MSKIIIDAREYSTSTGRYVSNLIHSLEQTNSEHKYVILLNPNDMDKCQLTNPRFSKVACPHKEFTFDEQLGLLGQIQDLHPDLVHFCAAQQPIGYRGLVVTTIHDLTTARFHNPSKNSIVFSVKQQVYKGVIKYVAQKSAALITPSAYVKQDVAAYTHISADKITVTYEAADRISDDPEPLADLSDSEFIMYVGRPMIHKNLGRLIDAFARLKQTHPDLKLVLCGKTDVLYEKHYEYVQEQGIADVVFTGYVSEAQLRWLYENCQAYVFPSLSEGFGLPGLEAMAHGAPVVSSNATCLPEIYGSAAEYFDPLNVTEMADKINLVISDLDHRTHLIHAGNLQVQQYSWQQMALQTLGVYNEVLAKAATK